LRTKFIVNPMANKGGCGKRWPHIRTELEKSIGRIGDDMIALTRAPNHATLLAADAVGAGCRCLVAVGGDGTFNEVLNGVIMHDRPLTPDLILAQVPAGTSNELSRAFAQHSPMQAGEAIACGQTRMVDVFRADARGYAGDPITRYGCILAIAGAPATISWRAQRAPLLKRLGPMSYVFMTAVTALTYAPCHYRVEIDAEAERSAPMWGLLLCSFAGGGKQLLLAPGADRGDGKLDLVMLGDLGRWEILTGVVPRLSDGSYLQRAKIARRQATRVTISSDRQVRADVDGESIGCLPMSIALLPFRVRVAARCP